MASMFSAAAALFARTNISQNYTILAPGVTVTVPGNMGLPSLPAGPPFKAGLWLVQPAQHKLNGKRVSVWTFEKRGPEMERLGGGSQAKETVLELLKAEVSPVTRILAIFFGDHAVLLVV
jgi:SCY1-like protein 2